jgi:hypothetical protein
MIHEHSQQHTRVVLTLLVGIAVGYGLSILRCSQSSAPISAQRCALRTAMRRLWADHVIWTRNYLISSIANLEDLKHVTERLLKNQADIGATIGVYYGQEVGNKLAALLKDHIVIAVKVVDAAKGNNKEVLAQANEEWHKNAQDIAKFLSGVNPQWPYDALIKMLNEHLQLTTEEAVARIKKDWKQDVIVFDKVFAEVLDMADQLTNGIVAQFSQKF